MARATLLPARRPGFTLIELLIVIAIIVVMVGLLLSGVSAVQRAQKRTQTLYEIKKLDQSLEVAFSRYNDAKSLPGKLILINRLDAYLNPNTYAGALGLTPTEVQHDIPQSKAALTKMFGPNLFRNVTPAQFVYWDGSQRIVAGGASGWQYQPGNNNGIARLQGQDCLVFYLGGIMLTTVNGATVTSKLSGFATNPRDPSDFLDKSSTPGNLKLRERVGPFYEFQSARLTPSNAWTKAAGFFCYLDPYGSSEVGVVAGQSMPYAYFGLTVRGTKSAAPNLTIAANSYYSDCTALGLPQQYKDQGGAGNDMNSNTFQIVSAGRDKIFGDPTKWTANSGTTSIPGRDDLSNFSQGQLADGTR
jgi:prepilin-type N-terminal cleavage/methylation domain-containing protein